jgi:hypothetical protein
MDSGALVIGLSALLAALGDDRRRVVGVGVAGIAESGVPLDRSRRALAPVIAWLDPRGGDEVAQVEQHFGPDLALRTGERLRPVATVAKLGWLVAHGVQGVERWLGVPELVVHALTGAEATEHSLAARTGCYDVTKQVWIPEVAALLDFDVDVFPPVHAAGTVMGRVTEDGAAWSGLAPGVAVTVAGHDHLAGMVGAGVGRHDLANSVGTAETIVGRVRDRPDLSAALEQRVAVRLVPGGREFAVLVSAARAGVVLEAAAAALGRSLADLDGLAEGGAPVDVGDAVDRLAGGTTPAFPDAPPGGADGPDGRRVRAAGPRHRRPAGPDGGLRWRQRQPALAPGQGPGAACPRRPVDRLGRRGPRRGPLRRRGRRLVALGRRGPGAYAATTAAVGATGAGGVTWPLRSRPTVVVRPWPGRTSVSSGSVASNA